MSLGKFNTMDMQFDQLCTRLGKLNIQINAQSKVSDPTDSGNLVREVTRLLDNGAILVQEMVDECKNHDTYQRKLLLDKVMAHRNILRHNNQLQAARIRGQRLKEEISGPDPPTTKAIKSMPSTMPTTPTGEDFGAKLSYEDIKTALLTRELIEKEKAVAASAREAHLNKLKKEADKERRRQQRHQRLSL